MKRSLIRLIAIASMLCLCACASAPESISYRQIKTLPRAAAAKQIQVDNAVEQAINEYNTERVSVSLADNSEDTANEKLELTRCACRVGDNCIVYPRVSDDAPAAKEINNSIMSIVQSLSDSMGVSLFTDYRVECNDKGIFSIRMFLYDMYDESGNMLDCVPLTFNSKTGELCRICDLFGGSSQNWRGRIPDLITAQAENEQILLLSDVMPISDDRQYYVTDDSVVIMYDLYEISTYEAGEPEFVIKVNDIAQYIDKTSALNEMVAVPAERDVSESASPLPEAAEETADSPAIIINTPDHEANVTPTDTMAPTADAFPAQPAVELDITALPDAMPTAAPAVPAAPDSEVKQ